MVQSADSNKPDASNQKFVNFPLRNEFFMPLWYLEEMQNLYQSLLLNSPFRISDPPRAGGVGAPASLPRPPVSELESRFYSWVAVFVMHSTVAILGGGKR